MADRALIVNESPHRSPVNTLNYNSMNRPPGATMTASYNSMNQSPGNTVSSSYRSMTMEGANGNFSSMEQQSFHAEYWQLYQNFQTVFFVEFLCLPFQTAFYVEFYCRHFQIAFFLVTEYLLTPFLTYGGWMCYCWDERWRNNKYDIRSTQERYDILFYLSKWSKHPGLKNMMWHSGEIYW
jgi:hypothetical protein